MVGVVVGQEDALEVVRPRAQRRKRVADTGGLALGARVHERPAVIVFEEQDVDDVRKPYGVHPVDAVCDLLGRTRHHITRWPDSSPGS